MSAALRRIAIGWCIGTGIVIALASCESESTPEGATATATDGGDAGDSVGPCGETATHTPTKSEGEACSEAGLVCGSYTCNGTTFQRTEPCLTSPSQIGTSCEVTPGYDCTLPDHCGGLPENATYRGYQCLDGVWTDVTSTPCPRDAATD